MTAGVGVEKSPFLRRLTSSDVPTRKQAFDTLRLYLQRPFALEEVELLKLWKGLFYCMWLTANPKPQQRLAQDFASLVSDTLADRNVLPFVDAFWTTMAREWAGIDSLRSDKYLRLMRFVLRATLQRLGDAGFDAAQLDGHNQVMQRTPLNINNARIPNGMRYHLLDIFVDELGAVKQHIGDWMDSEVVTALLAPLRTIRASTADKHVRKRANEALTDPRLNDLGVPLPESEMSAAGFNEDSDDFEGFED